MKKIFALSLLVIGNLTAVLVLAQLALALCFYTLSAGFGIVLGICVLIAIGFAASRFFKLFNKKYGTSPKQFFLFSYLPPVIFTAIYWIVYLILDAAGYFSGWFAGFGEAFIGISFIPAALIHLFYGVIWYNNVTYPDNENGKNIENIENRKNNAE